jgi:hypothetical protein
MNGVFYAIHAEMFLRTTMGARVQRVIWESVKKDLIGAVENHRATKQMRKLKNIHC